MCTVLRGYGRWKHIDAMQDRAPSIASCSPIPGAQCESAALLACRLGESCLAYEADERPTFRDVNRTLSAIKIRLKGISADDTQAVNASHRAFSFPR